MGKRASSSSSAGSRKYTAAPSSPSNTTARVLKPDVSCLQRFWRFHCRYHTTRRLVENYFATGPTIEHVTSIR